METNGDLGDICGAPKDGDTDLRPMGTIGDIHGDPNIGDTFGDPKDGEVDWGPMGTLGTSVGTLKMETWIGDLWGPWGHLWGPQG